ncbi:uncharacterized protein LOC129608849 [Condylostylus longicornis]|uniref:uncharacterized protein LOC129608849 n=1 Tax=Condylostylus longicornis TaxID=2530218 RepID=UPI00244E3A6E|nr:uncharacterized protein LOC129608849 [Condylostylus longicornis]XP_055376579.1 uncharacterized protein LOC129608849 [Condylostylus longicornis]XP_055376580.1 uncharacterized protein LOC129608849 [Condylostylus longicornis]XP_055376581.1 uncharacterized protein LOC129608849 [Condylostylus longicornis]
MILSSRRKMFSNNRMSFLILMAFFICLQLSNRRQFVSGDEEVASDLSVLPIQVDPNFKNFKYIGNKIIPDVSTIMKINEPHLNYLKEFLKGIGLADLEYEGYQIVKDVPFTIIVPKIDVASIEKTRLKDLALEHLIPGIAFGEFNTDELYGNMHGHKIQFNHVDLRWTLNGLKVIQKIKFNENLTVIFVDGILADKKSAFSKRNIQEHNSYNEPQRLEMKNTTTKNDVATNKDSTKSSPLMAFLSSMKSGTKVFQHFLLKSNLTQVMDNNRFTILIPADSAFQRWHPIDWGFYPFSVQEFTENILRNHFIPSSAVTPTIPMKILTSREIGSETEPILHNPLKMSDIKNNDKILLKTLGGETVVFRNNPFPSVNNVTILSDYTLPNGNQIFIISEVLFVSEAVVSKLHQMHKDKETPPLLAFPWFGAQFLSHSFLALERDSRFTQITRYLNNAEIAPYVSGANYTFFVPEDRAFIKNGFNNIPDEVLASQKGVKMLLNHFIKGRLYERDLKDDEVFETIGGGLIKVQRKAGNNVTVNMAKIIESEVFVYNLGTMFYIDDILYAEMLRNYDSTISSKTPSVSTVIPSLSSPSISTTASSIINNNKDGTNSVTSNNFNIFSPTNIPTTSAEVEIVPSELITENTATESDILLNNGKGRIPIDPISIEDELDEDEIITPKALPVRLTPKK